MLTVNQIIAQVQTLANAHHQIAEVGVGTIAELQAKERSYPLLWVSHEAGSLQDNYKINNIRLTIFDRVITGQEGQDDSFMEQEVLSDTELILLDFLNYFHQNHTQDYVTTKTAPLEHFTERTNDRTAGWSTVLELRQFYDWNKCSIPESGATIDPTVDGLTLYDFCDSSVINRLTADQVACIQSEFCGVPDPVTIQLNGVTYTTAASGTTFNQVVENAGGVSVGTSANPSVVANSVINFNGSDVDEVKAEDTFPFFVKQGGVNVGSYDQLTKTVTVPTSAAPSVTIGAFSDAGHTTPITSSDWNSTVYLKVESSGVTPTNYLIYARRGKHIKNIVEQSGNTYTWTTDIVGQYTIVAEADDGSIFAFDELTFTVNEISLANDASSVARWTFEDDSYLTFNGSTISQITDANGNGKTLIQSSAAIQPEISSYTSATGLQFARFVSDMLQNTYASPVNYPNITFILVMGCDGNSSTTRVGRITKTGEVDFSGTNSIAMQETRMQKSGAGGGGKYDRELSVLVYRIESGVTTYTDFFTCERQLSSTLGVPTGGIEFENVFMGMNNADGVNVAEWHFIGRKLSDAETANYGNYMNDKWNG